MNCKNCGAPLEGAFDVKLWKCEYCNSTNYNEIYLKNYFDKIDFKKVTNFMTLAINAYNNENYDEAINYFNKVLEENSNEIDAWIFKGIALAKNTNLSNFEENFKNSQSCFKSAKAINANYDFLDIALNIANDEFAYTILRMLNMHFEEANKIYNAFSSTDIYKAVTKMNAELEKLFNIAYVFYDLECNNLKILIQGFLIIIDSHSLYRGNENHTILINKIYNKIEEIKIKHPNLITQDSQQTNDYNINQSSFSCQLVIFIILLLFFMKSC